MMSTGRHILSAAVLLNTLMITNPGFVFYSFRYLSDPKGSLGHKVPEGENTEKGTKLMQIVSHAGTKKYHKI